MKFNWDMSWTDHFKDSNPNPIKLSPDDLKEYREIYKHHYGYYPDRGGFTRTKRFNRTKCKNGTGCKNTTRSVSMRNTKKSN